LLRREQDGLLAGKVEKAISESLWGSLIRLEALSLKFRRSIKEETVATGLGKWSPLSNKLPGQDHRDDSKFEV
jgi:hypothetical protein